jgi:hypothetical protein
VKEKEMNCKETRQFLTAYLDGEVTDEEQKRIEAHLSVCPHCRAELEALSAAQTSLRGALKSKAGEVSPSDAARKKVQARLNGKSAWFADLHRLLSGKVLRAAAITAMVALMAIVAVVWQFGGAGQAPPIPSPTPAPTPGPGPTIYIKAEANQDKNIYLPGDIVVIDFSFENVSSEPLQIDYFPPPIRIVASQGEVQCLLPAGENAISLEPDEVATYTLEWNPSDEQIPYGNYYINLGYIELDGRTVSLPVSGDRQFLILPEEGVMEKTVEVNESRTVNGVTFTLQRVEMTATGMEVYAFNVPEDYPPPGGPPMAPPELMQLHAEAKYSLDGGPWQTAGLSGISFLEDGMRHSWTHLNPVPKGTEKITFVITRLGNDQEGPWKFEIPLGQGGS